MEAGMAKIRFAILIPAAILLLIGNAAAQKMPLQLIQTVPLPALHDGDFDHFTADVPGNRLFSAAEENSKVLVFNLRTGRLLHTIGDLKAPHSLLYRGDLKKLFVVDGGLGEVRIYDGATYRHAGDIFLRKGADSAAYDPATKYLYVVTGGRDARLPNCFLEVVDTTRFRKVGEIELDSNNVEAVVLARSGPRMFVVIRGNNAIEVFNRRTRALLATWPMPSDVARPTAMAFDEPAHRLFIGTRNPGKLIVLDSDSGRVVTSLDAAPMVDDMAYDAAHSRIYFAGSGFLDVFQQNGANRYALAARIPTRFRAKTGIFVPQLDRYYLGVPHQENNSAELRIYEAAR
jgi:DNA-binding beta-propeller fold protein YncE